MDENSREYLKESDRNDSIIGSDGSFLSIEEKKSSEPDGSLAHYRNNMLGFENLDRKKKKQGLLDEEENVLSFLKITDDEPELKEKNRNKKKKSNPVKTAVKKKNVPVKIPKKKPLTMDKKIDNAMKDYLTARNYAYRAKQQEGVDVGNLTLVQRWKGFGWWDSTKRTRKANEKKVYQDAAKAFLNQRNAAHEEDVGEPLPEVEVELNEERINEFLQVSVDQFRLNTDAEFTQNLEHNYELAGKADEMEKLLDQVIQEKVQINEDRLEAVTKHIQLIKSVKEWMDARLDLINDPHYVLLSSRELADSAAILAGMRLGEERGYEWQDEPFRTSTGKVRAFLEKYEKVQKCDFNRTLHRENNEEFRAQLQNRALEKGDEMRSRIHAKQSEERDKRSLSEWREKRNQCAAGAEGDAALFTKEAENFDFDNFEQTELVEFQNLPLTALRFATVDDILNHFADNQKLFQKAEIFQNHLAQYLYQDSRKKKAAGNYAPKLQDDQIMNLRAKIEFFRSAKKKQLFLMEGLKSEDVLNGQTLEVWVQRQNVTIENPESLYNHHKSILTAQKDAARAKLVAMWKELNPDRPREEDEINRNLEEFQRNILFWETIRDTRKTLDRMDEETKLFAEQWCRDNQVEPIVLPKEVLIYLRGKNAESRSRIMNTCVRGDANAKNALKAEIAKSARDRIELDASAYEIREGVEESFLKGLAGKMSDAELMTVMPTEIQGVKPEDQKELQAAQLFGKEIVGKRLDTLLKMTSEEDFLCMGGISFADINEIKEHRLNYEGMLRDNKHQNEGKASAERIFKNIDTLQVAEFELDTTKNTVKEAVLLDTDLQVLYQSYRKACGIAVVNQKEQQQKRMELSRNIKKRKTDPLYATPEEIRDLRLLCIDTLRRETKIREELLYDLSTESLKLVTIQTLEGKLPALPKAQEKKAEKKAAKKKETSGVQMTEGYKKYLEQHKEPDVYTAKGTWDGQEYLNNREKILKEREAEGNVNKDGELTDKGKALQEKIDGKMKKDSLTAEENKALQEEIERKRQGNVQTDQITKQLEAEVLRLRDKEKKRQEEAEEPDWNEKEQDVVNLMTELTEKKVGTVTDGAWLLKIMNGHLEILSDLGNWNVDEYDRQVARQSELKKELTYAESLPERIEDLKFVIQTETEKAKAHPEEYEKEKTDEKGNRVRTLLEQAELDLEYLKKKQVEVQKTLPEKKEEYRNLSESIRKFEQANTSDFARRDAFSVVQSKMSGPEKTLLLGINGAVKKVLDHVRNELRGRKLTTASLSDFLKKDDAKLKELLNDASGEIQQKIEETYQEVQKTIELATNQIFDARVAPYINPDALEEGLMEEVQREESNVIRKEDEGNVIHEEDEGNVIHTENEEPKENIIHTENEEPKENIIHTENEEPEENIIRTDQKKPEDKKDDTSKKKERKITEHRSGWEKKRPDTKEEAALKAVDKAMLTYQAKKYAENDQAKEKAEKDRVQAFAEDSIRLLHKTADPIDRKMEEIWSTKYGEGKYISIVLKNYFKGMGEKAADPKEQALRDQDRRHMMCTMFKDLKPEGYDKAHTKTNALRKAGRYLGGLVKGAGPLLQKKLQGIPEESLTLELRQAVKDVKSNLAPIDPKYVKKVMKQIVDESNGDIEKLEIEESLGAASVGQAFRCRIKGKGFPEGSKVVVKLLRPDAKERIDREKALMLKCASDEYMHDGGAMQKTYLGELSKIEEELDLTIEAKNCEEGESYISTPKELTPAKAGGPLPGKVNSVRLCKAVKKNKMWMVMDEAKGTTVDRYVETSKKEREAALDVFTPRNRNLNGRIVRDPGNRRVTEDNLSEMKPRRHQLVKKLQEVKKRHAHLEAMSRKWVTQALYGNGFYHGDMHPGNIMVSQEEGTMLDFGNATKLTKKQQSVITSMCAAMTFGRSADYLDFFLQLLPESNEKKKQFTDKEWLKNPENVMEKMLVQKAIIDVMKLGDYTRVGEKIYLSLIELQKRGFEIPREILSFSQSELRLQNALESMKNEAKMLDVSIRAIDNLKTQQPYADVVLLAQQNSQSTVDKKEYYRGLISAIDVTDKKDFTRLLLSKDKKEQEEFDKKYMSMFQDLELFMSGKKIDRTSMLDEDDDPVYIPGFHLDYKVWEKEFLDTKRAMEKAEKKGGEEGEEEANRIRREYHEKVSYVYFSNPVVDNLGLSVLDEMTNLCSKAFKTMDIKDFRVLLDLFERTFRPVLNVLADVKKLRGMKNGKDKDALAEKIYKDYSAIKDVVADKHQIFTNLAGGLYGGAFDTDGPIEDMDYRLEQLKHYGEVMEKELAPWFLDGKDGAELKAAYQEFRRIQKVQIPEKYIKHSNGYDRDLAAAEKRFKTIYKRMAVKRLKEHVKMLEEEPEDVTQMKSFMDIMGEVVQDNKVATGSAITSVGGLFAGGRYTKYATTSKETSDHEDFEKAYETQKAKLSAPQLKKLLDKEKTYE